MTNDLKILAGLLALLLLAAMVVKDRRSLQSAARLYLEEKVAKEAAVKVIRECRQSSMRERRALEESLAQCRDSKLDRP